ncbi:hypothetical protein K9L16_03730 [Candidatus Pacearchaeota archaeon]|nr:hypothetical protein [Candidatus Pacearchaeota archaeon]
MALNNKQILQMYDRAQILIGKGDYSEAKELYETIIQDMLGDIKTVQRGLSERLAQRKIFGDNRKKNLKMEKFILDSTSNIRTLLEDLDYLKKITELPTVPITGREKERSIN